MGATGVSNENFNFREELKGNPNELIQIMDITLQSHINEIYTEAMEKFGIIDVVINNGGNRQRSGRGGSNYVSRRVRADNVVPLALHLAEQDASGITGQWVSCMEWNEKNGLGGFEAWVTSLM